jgi:hypothetical protein
MATVSIDIPTAATPRIRAMVEAMGPQILPQEDLPQGKQPSGWTNAEALGILKLMLRKFVMDLVKQVEVEAAANAALASVETDNLVT